MPHAQQLEPRSFLIIYSTLTTHSRVSKRASISLQSTSFTMASVPKYKSIKQRDGDPISGRTKLIHDAHERIKLDSQEAPLRTPRKKMPFDNVDLLASTAFIVTGLACFISAVLLLLNRSSSFGDLQILSAKSVRGVDCSTIQVAEKASEAVITLMKEIRQGGVTSGPGSASRDIQKVFTLDFKTPSILSYEDPQRMDSATSC